ncbi:hypothetical protein [Micromonospora ureilytica]|uniref:hypothetical protein n=1 Tax=Micromonospora ureilytica TaxID=709868 RepID=UPI00403A0EBF
MRKIERWHSARLRHASQEGVAAYLANEDAEVYNVTDAAVKRDALAAALNLTALTADAVTALAAVTKRDPHEVLRTLQSPSSGHLAAGEATSGGSDSPPGVRIVYPDAMDESDWSMTESTGWIEITVHWAGSKKAITFYDPTRLSQEVQSALAESGYFVERAAVIVPTLSKEAIEAVVALMALRHFVDIR